MSSEILSQMAKDAGVEDNDLKRMVKNGLTESLAKSAKDAGMDLRKVWTLYQQYGAHGLAVMTSVFACLEKPHQQHQHPLDDQDEQEKNPRVQPVEVEKVDDEEEVSRRTGTHTSQPGDVRSRNKAK